MNYPETKSINGWFHKPYNPSRTHEAKGEVVSGNFYRRLGFPEVPEHIWTPTHILSKEIKGHSLPMRRVPGMVTTPHQHLVDMLGAERYLGLSDRHNDNYIMSHEGTIHPIDFGHHFTHPTRKYDHALISGTYADPDHPISDELHGRLIRMLPVLRRRAYKYRQSPGKEEYDRINHLEALLKSGTPVTPTLMMPPRT